MSDTPNKAIEILIGIVLVCALGGLAFWIWNIFSGKTKDTVNDMVGEITVWQETEFTQFEGEVVKGSAVLNEISTIYSADKNVYVTVKTTSDTTGKTYCYSTSLVKNTSAAQSTLITNAKDKTKPECISPNGDFLGEIIRNGNGDIIGLIFTQQ